MSPEVVIQVLDPVGDLTRAAATVAWLGRVTFTETFGELFAPDVLADYLARTFGEEKIAASLRNPANFFLLAFAQGRPVGYLKLKRQSRTPHSPEDPQMQLQKIYVLRDYLSQHVGKHLLHRGEAQARQEGAVLLWLTVLATNERALAFYRRHGFAPASKKYFTIGADTLEYEVMTKGYREEESVH